MKSIPVALDNKPSDDEQPSYLKNQKNKTQKIKEDASALVKQMTMHKNNFTKMHTKAFNNSRFSKLGTLNNTGFIHARTKTNMYNKKDTKEIISKLVNIHKTMNKDEKNYDSETTDEEDDVIEDDEEEKTEKKRGQICLPSMFSTPNIPSIANNIAFDDIDEASESGEEKASPICKSKARNSGAIKINNQFKVKFNSKKVRSQIATFHHKGQCHIICQNSNFLHLLLDLSFTLDSI